MGLLFCITNGFYITCASEYHTMQITFTHLPTIIYYALTSTYPPNKLVSNMHKSDNEHRFLLLKNVGYSITENVWACGEFQADPHIADHSMFKLGHFPIIHFKTSNYYLSPYQKVSTFEAWSAVIVSIVQNGSEPWSQLAPSLPGTCWLQCPAEQWRQHSFLMPFGSHHILTTWIAFLFPLFSLLSFISPPSTPNFSSLVFPSVHLA